MKLFGPRYPEEIARRIPAGQRLVKTWPVLHFGPVPDFDESSWDLEVSGLVDNPYRLTYSELKDLGPVDVEADIRHFGRRGKIFHVQFRNVRGSIPTDGGYEEVLLDDGDLVPRVGRQGGRPGARQVGDRALRLRVHVRPVARGDAVRRRAGRVGARR